jgi:hypothetical protein
MNGTKYSKLTALQEIETQGITDLDEKQNLLRSYLLAEILERLCRVSLLGTPTDFAQYIQWLEKTSHYQQPFYSQAYALLRNIADIDSANIKFTDKKTIFEERTEEEFIAQVFRLMAQEHERRYMRPGGACIGSMNTNFTHHTIPLSQIKEAA